MTAATLSHPRHQREFDDLLERLEREHFPASQLSRHAGGQVAARFFQSLITSSFDPIARASDGGVVGHHALMRIFGDHGGAVSPWRFFAQASDDRHLVQLDRLSRTLHALNYFPANSEHALFLSVDRRLLTAVRSDHGAYFETILRQLGVPPQRVTIALPAAALDDPVALVRAAISYRIRGYHVLVEMRPDAEADLEHVYLADPHFVSFDISHAAAARSAVEALARRGTKSVALRVESDAQAQAARDAGFAFLQGRHLIRKRVRA